MTSAGSCFGRHVRSNVPLLFTRDALDPAAIVSTFRVEEADNVAASADDELLIRWTRTAQNPREVAVFRSRELPDRHLVSFESGGTFVVHPGRGTIVMPTGGDQVGRESRLWGLPSMLCLIADGDLPVHAAALEIDGSAVLVGGLTTAGKSTLGAAAVRAGWRLLSEDTTALRLGTRCAVLPGAASLRMRPDVAPKLGLDDSRRWTMDDGRVQLSLPLGGRGDSRPVPLTATVLLAWADETLRLEPVPTAQALRELWSLTFRIPQAQDRVRCFDQLAILTGAVPTFRLHRPRDLNLLDATLDLLAEVARA